MAAHGADGDGWPMTNVLRRLDRPRRAGARLSLHSHASAAWLAAAWSAAYGALGLWWAAGGAGFPFGLASDPLAGRSLWAAAQPASGGRFVAAAGLAAALAAVAMARSRPERMRRAVRATLLSVGWAASLTLLVLVPDHRPIAAVGYAPVFLLGAPFGWPPVSYAIAIPWPVLNQFLCMGGGVLWAWTALAFARRARGACVACGRVARAGRVARWTAPAAAARWGALAAYVAAAVPVLYALTRLAWLAGIPLGISDALLREGQANGMWWAGGALASVAIGGAVLTLGLAHRWGEIFPRWIPLLAGRHVPPALAVVPATFASLVVVASSVSFVRDTIRTGFRIEGWAAEGPALLWPLWGVALGAATLAYHHRRRGACARCGRG
jgi:hypothetical protein